MEGVRYAEMITIQKGKVNEYSLFWLLQMPYLPSFSALKKQLETWILVGIVFYLTPLYDMKESRGLCVWYTDKHACKYIYMGVEEELQVLAENPLANKFL